ncbi:high-potential iron-sulfur protein [Rhodothermus profundi]|uniref:Tat (Twin-arginine translocation) pathway signal sequence n=1 Tax=Rhodothermus profundi TaxID=633813 RepID=A0A1M6WQ99_9BACT|nr:high-potential iron-sulfur protein [Rhodothermus profundi]SHK95940.1 Tat (twin-arginine translocation) pathway signal sequence [Rhodothermus profundi]
MDDKRVTRRDFLLRVGALGLAGLGASSLLSACGGGQQQQQTAPQPEAASVDTAAAASADFSCTDVSGLTAEEIQMRESLQYTDHSPYPDKTCSNCQLFIPAESPNQCGACQLIKGPIHPDGYCTSWVQKVS